MQETKDQDWQVNTVQPTAAEWAVITVSGQGLTMLVDTGSPATIVSPNTIVPGLKLRESQLHLTSFTGQAIRLRGEGEVRAEVNGQTAHVRLVVSERGPHRPIMGWEWIRGLKTVSKVVTPYVCPVTSQPTLNEILERHQEVFNDEMGKIPLNVSLRLNEGLSRCIVAPDPFALQEAVEQELDKWKEQGVADRVPPGSGWGTPLVVIPTQTVVRICADYRLTVNPQLEPLKYPMGTAEELFSVIRGRHFAKLDCRSAYLRMG